MAKKFIDVMDTTFRDGFQSVFGARVLMDDFLPAVSAAKEAGINHFEFGGGARFQSLYFYLNEDAFLMMDKFRQAAGNDANLQTLSRGVNTVTLDTGSRELVDLHAKLFAKHNTNTIRNFDALNDVKNLKYSGERIVHHGLKHEVVVTMMDLPPNCEGAHDAAFYEKCLRDILNSDIKFHSVCFKDASGTSSPEKVYQTIKMARRLLGDSVHLRLHTHETAGVSVACYLAALEAGADGIDLAASPVSGGTSQPDILTMLHAVKGKNYDLGGLDVEKILKYEDVLHGCLKDYFMPPEATQVSPLIPFSPMPGGALTANTQMMRDNNILDKFPAVIKAMREVVEKGGYGTSVTPVSQFYFQQAFNNVMFGPWKKIAEGYGKMVLGYFGKTPVTPHQDIVELASKQLGLEPTNESAIDIADNDETKSLSYTKAILEKEGIEQTEENIFIAAACKEKGVAYLKGEGKVMVRKISNMSKQVLNQAPKTKSEANKYSVVVNGSKYNVEVSDGFDNFQIKSVTPATSKPAQATEKKDEPKTEQSSEISSGNGSSEIRATMSAGVFKILVKAGDTVGKGQTVVVLEAMKMEIPVESPSAGVVSEILITQGQSVDDGQILIKL
ncbi:TPA: biotin attachment protein [Campylobacter fetus subsp. venerealis]|uniref:Pyruvate carboxylase, subunit B n=2 Tax=Campylobacter fetus TaxID=196 RepID=A0AAE6J0B8_CAMFE|nr:MULTISPECIES: biotin/lipoyl-containing protein [Campylobacter]OCS21771.1 biotin attachment protein [Campylobacter fetus subsp. venerealis cfvi97/532]OCS25969.1 biotin attachment protein [Campylobacter fetus subsp. venerealis cfvB10]OCS28958.1 biotin attachment protein [Campylobacter fetus subsp. venerealis LMG 6570 = CCUG 33900]AHE94639.1 pyruvate carboxylase, subunit B [Campylobacter fetus subsp. venerealis cfvi03/293]AIR81054.1 pyruvate carboxylase, subunit B [Campylobacter fetus subsp. v